MEKKENLKDVIEHELYEMLRLTSLMQPKSDEEFIAVALPNLHIKVYEIIQSTIEDTIKRCEECVPEKKLHCITDNNSESEVVTSYNDCREQTLNNISKLT